MGNKNFVLQYVFFWARFHACGVQYIMINMSSQLLLFLVFQRAQDAVIKLIISLTCLLDKSRNPFLSGPLCISALILKLSFLITVDWEWIPTNANIERSVSAVFSPLAVMSFVFLSLHCHSLWRKWNKIIANWIHSFRSTTDVFNW